MDETAAQGRDQPIHNAPSASLSSPLGDSASTHPFHFIAELCPLPVSQPPQILWVFGFRLKSGGWVPLKVTGHRAELSLGKPGAGGALSSHGPHGVHLAATLVTSSSCMKSGLQPLERAAPLQAAVTATSGQNQSVTREGSHSCTIISFTFLHIFALYPNASCVSVLTGIF